MEDLRSYLEQWEKRRDELISQIQESVRLTGRLLEAFMKVPRNLFVQDRWAFMDIALPIDFGQTSSQPSVIARMLQLLEVSEEHKVLEIGTGSGYQTALLCELAREVFSMDIFERFVRRTEHLLETLGYRNFHLKVGDGCKGWKEHAPYDRIIVSARAEDVPDELLSQLGEGGIMVIPLGDEEFQFLTKIIRKGGKLERWKDIAVRFVPLLCD